MTPAPESPSVPPATGDGQKRKILLGTLALLLLVGLGVAGASFYQKIERSSNEHALMGRLGGLRAAENQFALENGSFFVRYEELVGPNCYLKGLTPVAGEDYRALFPHLVGLGFAITTPGGFHAEIDYAGPQPDGMHAIEFTDGQRLEITWQGGEPHGPVHAFNAKGKLWAEAVMERGRLAGPSWVYDDKGQRHDEFKSRPLPAHP